MPYCDGGSFSGSNDTITVHNDTKLFFRGKHVLDAIIEDLLTNAGEPAATAGVDCCLLLLSDVCVADRLHLLHTAQA
jgi:hypothetical protein